MFNLAIVAVGIAAALALIAIGLAFLRRRDARRGEAGVSGGDPSGEGLADFDAEFLAAAGDRETREVARARTRVEIDMMRSMLHSAGIPSMARYGLSDVFGVSGGVDDSGEASVSVFAEDWDEARKVVDGIGREDVPPEDPDSGKGE